MPSIGGRAVFEAVGNFKGLIAEGKAASRQLDATAASARKIGAAVPPGGGGSGAGLAAIGASAGVMSGKMSSAGRSATMGLTLPILGVGAAAVHSFTSFETAIAGAGIKTGATTAQLAEMKAVATKVGAETKFTMAEAANALDELGGMGLSAKEAIAALPAVMNAAQASNEDLGLTTQVTAQAMNAFNIPATQTTHIADVMAAMANNSALKMQGLGEALSHAGVLGGAANQSLEDVTGWIAILVNQGIPAASAGTAIRQAMVSLMSPSKKAAGVLKDLGVNVRDSHGKMLPIPEVLARMQKALDLGNPKMIAFAKANGLAGQAARDYALKTAFGVEGSLAMNLAMGKGKPLMLDMATDTIKMTQLQKGLAKTMGVDGANAWIKAHTAAGKFTASGPDQVKALSAIAKGADGASEAAAKIYNATTAQKLDNMVGSLQSLAVTMITTVKPEFDWFIDKLQTLFNWFTKLAKIPFVGPLVIGAALILAALGPILLITAKIVGAFGQIATLGGKLKGKIGGGGGGSSGRTTGAGGPAGNVKVDNKVQVWWSGSMPVHVTQGPMSGPQDETTGTSGTTSKATKGSRARSVVKTVGRAGAAGVGGAVIGAAMSGGDLGTAAKSAGIFAGVELATEGVAKSAGKLGPVFKSLAGHAGNFAKSAVSGFTKGVVGAGKMLISAVQVGAKFIWMGLQALLAGAKMAIMWVIGLGPIGWIIIGIIALVALIVANWDKVKKFTIAAWNAIFGWVSNVVTNVVNWVKSHWLLLVAIIGGPLGLIIGLVIKYWSQIKAFIGAAIAWVWNVIKLYLGFVVAFWTAVWNGIKAAALFIWNGITAVIVGAITGIWHGIQAVFGLIRAGWSALWGGLSAVFSGIWTGVKAAISLGFNVIVGIVNTFIRGINWLLSKLPGGLHIPEISGFGSVTAQKKSGGGPIDGVGTGTSDSNLAWVSKGEHVLTDSDVKAAGGHAAIYAYRKSLHGYADGGEVKADNSVWGRVKGAAGWVVGGIGSGLSKLGDGIKAGAKAAISSALNIVETPIKSALNALPEGVLKTVVGGGFAKLDGKIREIIDGKAAEVAGGPLGHGALGGNGWMAMWRAVEKAVPGLHLTSSYRPGSITSSGNLSYHAQGRAIDLAPPSMALFNWIASKFGANSKELIYTPAGAAAIKDGKKVGMGFYGPDVAAAHYNHVHWAYDQGGLLPPGVSSIWNGTGQPENVQSPAQSTAIADSLARLGSLEGTLIAQTRALMSLNVGRGGVAPLAGGASSRKTEFNTTIVNPAPETASGSLQRTYSKIAYLGLDAKDA